MPLPGSESAALQEEAFKMVEKLLALTDQFSPAVVQATEICFGLRDKASAFELVEKALDVRDDKAALD